MATNPITPVERAHREPTRAEHLVSILGEKLSLTATVKNVYGEPIHAHNRTLVPVAIVGYGLGAGAGDRGDRLTGGGGGGGVGARPAGYIEITDAGSRYVKFSAVPRIAVAMVIGVAVGYLFGRFAR